MARHGPFAPVDAEEAALTVDVVLQYDPDGDSRCALCQAPNRRDLDIMALSTESPGDVVAHSGLGRASDSKLVQLVERHRWEHVVRVFDSIQERQALPNQHGPTLSFVDWTVGEIYDVYKAVDSTKERLECLRVMLHALNSRASMRGELVSNNRHKPQREDEIEISLTDDQRRKMLISEGQRLGLSFTEHKNFTEHKE